MRRRPVGMEEEGTEGIDLARLGDWMREAVAGVVPPLSARRFEGGRSNLTFALTDDVGSRWVLRRPPLGPRPATAHDVVREARIVAALAPSRVPVPAVIACCEDSSPLGDPFALMEHVDGIACRGAAGARGLGPAARARSGPALAEALAELHRIEPAEVGLQELGPGEAYVERQLRRWRRQWEAERVRPLPAIEEARGILAAKLPPQRRTRIVHGDYRLDNCLLDGRGEIEAVLDWEISTVGDPLADLGLLLVYWAEPGDEDTALEDPSTTVAGFCDRAALLQRYEEAAGEPAEKIEFHVALAWWKLACIVEGVYARARRGALGKIERTPDSFAAQAERLSARALQAARALP